MNLTLSGPKNKNMVSVTFDDGPHEYYTQKHLDILDTHSAKGTFFVTGINASKYPSIVREIADRGHEVANHTYSHPKQYLSSPKELYQEINSTNDLLEQISGQKPASFRPPYGIISPFLFSVCSKLHLKIILWNINSKDYNRMQSDRIANRVIKKINKGSIILFHDCHFRSSTKDYSSTGKALERVLYHIKTNGLSATTIEQLCKTDSNWKKS
jgi:peptidoglycan/xylan/chitin deacetylase (PgdA/CDA1 family)